MIAWLLQAGVAPLWAALGGVLAAAACGLLNGVLITGLRVMPFIVTLGAMGIIRGAAKGLAHEQKIDAPLSWLNDLDLRAAAGLPLAAAAPRRVAAHRPRARGGRRAALHAVRPPHLRHRLERADGALVRRQRHARQDARLHALGALAGLAGLMQFSRLTVGDPTVASGLELDVIAAVVIGGATLSGGEGSVLGSLVGAMLMTVIKTGGTHLGLSNWVQEIITGIIIIVAVALDRLRHRSARQ